MSLIRYLFSRNQRDELPKLRNHLTSLEARRESEDFDIQLLMMRGHFRDPRQAQAFLKKHGASSFEEVEEHLPEPPTPDWRGRLRRWLMLMEGSQDTNPHLKEDRETLRTYSGWWK